MRYWPERRRQKVGDERRVARDDDVVASTVGGWQTGGFEVGDTYLTLWIPLTRAPGDMPMTVRRASAEDCACTVMSRPEPRKE